MKRGHTTRSQTPPVPLGPSSGAKKTRPDRYQSTSPHLASAARARCRSIRWRHSAYSLVSGRYSKDLHHSSSESSRRIDEQLLSISAANRIANLKIMATSRQAMTPPPERFLAENSVFTELRSTL